MSWLSRSAPQIEAVAATVTALVAVIAIVGVKIQLDAADDLQKAQSARDAYRAHLALATSNPNFARPTDACAVLEGPDGGAYVAFVDHLMYSAEQMLDVSEGWEPTFIEHLSEHADYICAPSGPLGDTDVTLRLLAQFRTAHCPATPTCT